MVAGSEGLGSAVEEEAERREANGKGDAKAGLQLFNTDGRAKQYFRPQNKR